jgi:nucleoside-diphosphate-sugar epimerase
MKVLVTGASGRVGALVARELKSQNWDLCLLQRGESATRPADADGVEVLLGSVEDRDLVCDAVRGVDVVCHLAALMPPHESDSLFGCNVRGTFNLLEAIRTAERPPRLVFASSDATYGTGLSRRAYPTPIGEDLTPSPTNFYGLTKVVGEEMVRGYVDLYGLTAVILRYCWVFGPGEVLDLFKIATWNEFMTPEQRATLAESTDVPVLFADSGEPFSDHVIDARDAARATMLAIDARVDDYLTLNICGPNSFRYVDVAPRVAKALRRETVDLTLRSFHPYAIDTARAERQLGFRAEYDIDAMVDEALRERVEANG